MQYFFPSAFHLTVSLGRAIDLYAFSIYHVADFLSFFQRFDLLILYAETTGKNEAMSLLFILSRRNEI